MDKGLLCQSLWLFKFRYLRSSGVGSETLVVRHVTIYIIDANEKMVNYLPKAAFGDGGYSFCVKPTLETDCVLDGDSHPMQRQESHELDLIFWTGP